MENIGDVIVFRSGKTECSYEILYFTEYEGQEYCVVHPCNNADADCVDVFIVSRFPDGEAEYAGFEDDEVFCAVCEEYAKKCGKQPTAKNIF